MSTIAWLDLTNGVSGDMILGALVSAGVPLATMSQALAPLDLPITLSVADVDRAGMAAKKVVVDIPDQQDHSRTWRDVNALLDTVAEPIRGCADKVFAALAQAEGHAHGIDPEEVHFHEVGALDAIADVIAACAGLHALDVEELVVSPIALGGGTARTAHGLIPVPVPAVVSLAVQAEAPVHGGPDDFEMATPTGVAIATTLGIRFGAMPAMTPHRVGVGAGDRNPAGRPNVVRIVVGKAAGNGEAPTATVLEANIDDMDPRMWPSVLATLLEVGAGDAWLIPISMKKGRPAHTLCAIVSHERAADVRSAIFTHTTTIGIRESIVAKHALQREFRHVTVGDHCIPVKLGVQQDGSVVNAMPEWEDVARVAVATRRPVKRVLAETIALAGTFLTDSPIQPEEGGNE